MANNSGTVATGHPTGTMPVSKGEARVTEIRARMSEALADLKTMFHDARSDEELKTAIQESSVLLISEFETLRAEIHSLEKIASDIRFFRV